MIIDIGRWEIELFVWRRDDRWWGWNEKSTASWDGCAPCLMARDYGFGIFGNVTRYEDWMYEIKKDQNGL